MTTDQTDVLASRAQGRLGTVLRGKYRLDRVLGVGGMAVVYKATHRNEAEFAVKMLHPELSLHEVVRTRFLREGKAANSVKHPGAVLVVDDDVAEDGAAFLVMELLHGEAIESLWERHGERLPVRAVLSIAEQVLDVLAAAHSKGIVHRDIKPANLFATADGALKVLDFGIARVRDAAAAGHGGQATGTGMLLGTPAFMAPEQAFAKVREIDGQTDLWAVGATLFTLLSGQCVHEGENAAQLLVLAATVRARPLGSVAPDVPPGIAQVVDCALSFEKASRWPDAAAMRDAIQKASVEAFGSRASRAALADLVEDGEPASAAFQFASTNTPLGAASSPGTPPAVLLPGTADEGAGGGGTLPMARPASRVGGTTAQPVASLAESLPRPRRRGRRVLMAAGVAAVLVVGGLAVRAALATKHEAATAAFSTPPSAAPSSSGPAATAPDPVAASTAAAISPGVADAGSVSLTTPAAKPAAPPARPAWAPIAPRPLAPPAAPASAPTPNCNPPTYTDDNGHVHLKQGCQ